MLDIPDAIESKTAQVTCGVRPGYKPISVSKSRDQIPKIIELRDNITKANRVDKIEGYYAVFNSHNTASQCIARIL